MIYEEHNRPGELIPHVSLDIARPLYLRIGLARHDNEVEKINKAFKDAVMESEYSNSHVRRWEALQTVAPRSLAHEIATHVLQWTHKAYTSYHPANPNMSWASILVRFALGRAGWPDVGQTLEEQAQFNEFAEFFFKIWDWDNFNRLIDELEGTDKLSDWDRDIFMRYNMDLLDEDGNEPLAIFRTVLKGEALRRAIREFRFDKRPGFPHAKLRAAGQLEADKGWMPPDTPLGTLLEVV